LNASGRIELSTALLSRSTLPSSRKSGVGDVQIDFEQRQAKFLEGDVFAQFPDGEDVGHSLLDPPGSHVGALWLEGKVASFASLRLLADRLPWRPAKPRRGRTAARSIVNRWQKSRAQVH
jgi:hypothetical protein